MSVIKYIMEQENHPSFDGIYKALIDKIPTLSKTTIYNTLKQLSEKDISNALTIDEVEVRYDFIDCPHAYYKLDIRKLYSYLRVS